MFDVPLMIDNEARGASSGASFTRIDPLTNAQASKAAAATQADARAAASAAAAAFPAWSRTGPTERRMLLLKAADLLEARTPDFIARMTSETGATKIWSWARSRNAPARMPGRNWAMCWRCSRASPSACIRPRAP